MQSLTDEEVRLQKALLRAGSRYDRGARLSCICEQCINQIEQQLKEARQ